MCEITQARGTLISQASLIPTNNCSQSNEGTKATWKFGELHGLTKHVPNRIRWKTEDNRNAASGPQISSADSTVLPGGSFITAQPQTVI